MNQRCPTTARHPAVSQRYNGVVEGGPNVGLSLGYRLTFPLSASQPACERHPAAAPPAPAAPAAALVVFFLAASAIFPLHPWPQAPPYGAPQGQGCHPLLSRGLSATGHRLAGAALYVRWSAFADHEPADSAGAAHHGSSRSQTIRLMLRLTSRRRSPSTFAYPLSTISRDAIDLPLP